MRRGGGEDVPPVEARTDLWQPELIGLQQPCLDDPAESRGAGNQQPVVRPDQDVAASDPQGDRPSLRPDPRVDDRDVTPHGQIRQRAPEQQRAVADRELSDLVADIHDPRVRRDGQDHPMQDRSRRIARPEVGQQTK